jgi:DNA-binding PadR family transcriptional regulator
MRAIAAEGTLWELAVLALLREEPMHPYQMQRVLRDRREDVVLGLKRGSLYHAINRLVRSGMIEALTVDRQGGRPERTTYRSTPRGSRALIQWLRHRIATPAREPPEFMGSMSFLIHLPPAEAITRLEARAAALAAQIQELGAVLRQAVPRVGRIHLIEKEYLLAMHEAELSWLRKVIAEMRAGRLTWDLQKILAQVRASRRSPTRKERRT